MTKIFVDNHHELEKELPELPGLFLTDDFFMMDNSTAGLQIYVPMGSESPEWRHRLISLESFGVLQLMLKAAREIGDLLTQSLCLRSLISCSQQPERWYDELAEVLKIVQHNFRNFLKLCLSKFIICRDEASRARLREDILSIKDYSKLGLILTWARCVILRALATSRTEANLLLHEALTRAQEQPFPQKITDHMVKTGFLKLPDSVVEIPVLPERYTAEEWRSRTTKEKRKKAGKSKKEKKKQTSPDRHELSRDQHRGSTASSAKDDSSDSTMKATKGEGSQMQEDNAVDDQRRYDDDEDEDTDDIVTELMSSHLTQELRREDFTTIWNRQRKTRILEKVRTHILLPR